MPNAYVLFISDENYEVNDPSERCFGVFDSLEKAQSAANTHQLSENKTPLENWRKSHSFPKWYNSGHAKNYGHIYYLIEGFYMNEENT